MEDDSIRDVTIEQDGEYTRMRMNIQRGDGIDQRGDVSVEVMREYSLESATRTRTVTLPDGEEVTTALDDRTFAQFYGEVTRARDVLVEALGLDDEVL